MSLFKKIKDIIKSEVNYGKKIEINMNSCDDLYFDDATIIPENNNQEKEYYKILELEYGVGFNKIKSAYKRLLKKYHPDLYQNDSKKLETAQKLVKKINEAYTYFERKYQ